MELIGAMFILFFFGLGFVLFAFWIWAFVQVLKQSDEQGYQYGNQLIWILILLFLNFLGALLYYFMEYRSRPSAG